MHYKIKNKNLLLKQQAAGYYRKTKDLDFKGSDTQCSTHALHTYVAAMVPQLAETLIKEFVPPKQKILDPFCGGGAVMVEAVRNNRKAEGTDINPLAVLIAKTKSTYAVKSEIENACKYVLDTAIYSVNGSITFPEKYNVEYWFLPETISELSSIQKIILSCERNKTFDPKIINILKTVFSATTRDVMLTYRNEVRLRKLAEQHLTKFRPNAFTSFAKRAKIAAERISSLPDNAETNTHQMPVQQLSFEDKLFHSIICSPPYGDERNGVSYLQFSKLMLYWLGYRREIINDARGLTLGSKTTSNLKVESQILDDAFKQIEKVSGSKKGYEFYQDYFLGLKQMVRIVNEYIIIVIGDRILKTVLIKNGLVTIELMSELGCELIKHYQRTLPSKRLPKLRRENSHGYGGSINKEDILIFKVK